MADVITRLKLESTGYDSKLRDASRELAQFARTNASANTDFQKFTKSQVEAARAFGQISTSSRDAKGKVKELVGAYNDMARAYNTLTVEQKRSDWGRAMSESMQQLRGRIASAKQEMQQLSEQSSRMAQGTGNMSAALGDIGSKLGINSDLLSVVTTGTIGYTAAVTAGAAAVVAATKAWADYNSELSKQSQITSVTTGLSGASSDNLTAAGRSISKVYGVEFRDVINAANTLMTQFGKTSAESIELIRAGMQGMIEGDGGKLLSMIQQYAPAFRDAGISASQLVAIIQNSEGGLFTDQNMNAIVMGIKNIRLMTDQTSQALAKMGIDGAKMSRDLSSGAISIFDALKQVAGQLKTLESGSQVTGEVMQQVFGRQGVANGQLLAQAIEELNLNLDETKTQTGAVGESMAALEQSANNLEKAFMDATGVENWQVLENTIKSGLYQALAEAIRGAQTLGQRFADLPPLVQAIINPVGLLTGKMTDFGKQGESAVFKVYDALMTLTSPLMMVLKLLRSIGSHSGTGMGDILASVGELPGNTPSPRPSYRPSGGGGGGKSGRGSRGTTTPKKEVEESNGLIAKQQKLVNDLTKAWKDAQTPEEVARLAGELEDAQKKLEQLTSIGKQKTAELGEVVVTAMLPPLKEMEKVLNGLNDRLSKAKTPEEYQDILSDIHAVEKEMSQFKGADKLSKQGKDAANSWQQAASAISGVGSALQGIKDPVAKVTGIIAEAVANIALAFANASKNSGKEGNVWSWIAATAAGLGTMIATISSIKSATSGNYAEGGIIGGSSYSGDNMRVYGLNSGELVLNRAQQGNLASQLTGAPGMRLEAVVSAEDIRFVLNGNGRRTGRGEMVSTKMKRH